MTGEIGDMVITLLCVEFAVEDCFDHRGAGATIGVRDGACSMEQGSAKLE